MANILNPDKGVLRVLFLNVGQGESTLLLIPNGDGHSAVLVDSNKDETIEGLDVATFLKGKLTEGSLIYINTHPHKDHLKGIQEIHNSVVIGEIWHSGHTPHKDNKEEYDTMKSVISDIGEGCEFYLRGSNELNVIHEDAEETSKITKKIGEVDFRVFSPAKYVCDEIDDEDAETRRNRIHEQCGVIQFIYKGTSILLTGDSDKKSWQENIIPYYEDDVKSSILSASHHGSRSFFKTSEDDEDPYRGHMEKIAPDYLIISAPKDSPHDHPHDDALEIYKEFISEDSIFNLGEKNQILIVDIDQNGSISTSWSDGGSDNSTQDSKKNVVIPGSWYSSPATSKPYFPGI